MDIRYAFEDKAREIGGKVLGAGCLMVPPFTMDFSFALEGREYLVTLEEKKLSPVEKAAIDEKEAGNAD
jgi:hypothetical protein